MKRSGSACGTPARSPTSTNQRCQTSCRGRFAHKSGIRVDYAIWGHTWANRPWQEVWHRWLRTYPAQCKRHFHAVGLYAIEFRAIARCRPTLAHCLIAADFTHGVLILASYAFIEIKLASRHVALIIVCAKNSQKSLNFIDAFTMLIVTSKNKSWPRLIWPTL